MAKRWKVERFSRENDAPWADVGWNVYPTDDSDMTFNRDEVGDFDDWVDALTFAFKRARAEKVN